tara:strand:+ start:5148 stop:5396 length:249 start_codon:yes stop_codon:yes gene_type:complete
MTAIILKDLDPEIYHTTEILLYEEKEKVILNCLIENHVHLIDLLSLVLRANGNKYTGKGFTEFKKIITDDLKQLERRYGNES